MQNPYILVTESDLRRLRTWASRATAQPHDADALDALREDLARAVSVAPADVPRDVVTLGSVVTVRDLDTNAVVEYRLVAPEEADVARRRISVVAPLGLALLGRRVGEECRWTSPGGPRRLRIDGVPFQPEAAHRVGG